MRSTYVNEHYRGGGEIEKAICWAMDHLAYEFSGYSNAYRIGGRIVLSISDQCGDVYHDSTYDFDEKELLDAWRKWSVNSLDADDEDKMSDWLYSHDAEGAFTALPTAE